MSTTSKIPVATWDFSPAINYLRQNTRARGDETSPPIGNGSYTRVKRSPIETPSLGNFDAIFAVLSSQPIDIPARLKSFSSSEESSAEAGSYSTAASSPPDDISCEDFEDFVKRKSLAWPNKSQAVDLGHRHSIQSTAKAKRTKTSQLPQLVVVGSESPKTLVKYVSSTRSTSVVAKLSGFESEAEVVPITPISKKSKAPQDALDKNATPLNYVPQTAQHLTPAWVIPPKSSLALSTSTTKVSFVDVPTIYFDQAVIQPILHASWETKQLRLAARLLKKFPGKAAPVEGDRLKAIDVVCKNDSPDGIHVFVDSSNIFIGFFNALKKARGINKNAYTKYPPLAYHSLAMIMERGRGVGKRVLVGSSRDNIRPDYMIEAAQCGYEVSTLERVEKYKEAKVTRGSDIETYRRRSGGYSSSSSGSEAPLNAFKTVTEQGVDEILHMKMLESIVDMKEPSTMVLATGDAAVAEYSAGFFRNVERALEKGWRVEVVAWKESMSYAYRNRDFLEKWKGKFMVVELDEFQEELLGIYADD